MYKRQASDYTDGLAMKAVKMVFDYLPSAYENGANDPVAREKMANASCLAGMAFANAFLGLNHSMAHKLGAFHHLPHGVANAVLLTEVMRYNAAEVPDVYKRQEQARRVIQIKEGQIKKEYWIEEAYEEE